MDQWVEITKIVVAGVVTVAVLWIVLGGDMPWGRGGKRD